MECLGVGMGFTEGSMKDALRSLEVELLEVGQGAAMPPEPSWAHILSTVEP